MGPQNAAKLEEETEDFRHAQLGHDFKLALQKARVAKKLTQKELAQKINVKATIVNGESPTAGRCVFSSPKS